MGNTHRRFRTATLSYPSIWNLRVLWWLSRQGLLTKQADTQRFSNDELKCLSHQLAVPIFIAKAPSYENIAEKVLSISFYFASNRESAENQQ